MRRAVYVAAISGILLLAGYGAFRTSRLSADVNGAGSATARLTFLRADPPLFAPAPGSPIALPQPPSNVAAGDVNGDGRLDLVLPIGQEGKLAVLLGSGTGAFQPAPGSPLPLPEAGGEMALADLNGDGRLDVALANHDTYNVTILSGDGRGGFTPAPGSPVVARAGNRPHTHGLAVADLNRDGKPDLVTVNSTDQDVSVLLGDGQGLFVPAPGSPFAVGPSR